MSKENKDILHSLRSTATKTERAVTEAEKGHRHVQWGPNEQYAQRNSRELDELGQDVRPYILLELMPSQDSI